MGKKGSCFHPLSCVVRCKPKEKKNNKHQKSRKSQRLFWKHKRDESSSSEDGDTAWVNPAPPSPKPRVELIVPVVEEARDGYSARKDGNEDAPDSHFAGKDLENGDGHFVVKAENEDSTNAHSVENDRDECSAVEADNEGEMNVYSTEKDTGDGDGYSAMDADNEGEMSAHSPEKDRDDGDGYSVLEADNEDEMNARSAEKDSDDGDGYSAGKDTEDDQDRLDYSSGFTSDVAAEEEDVVVAEVVQLATAARPPVKSKEEVAAIKIQSVFRGYMARRSFHAVKGLMRLKTLVRKQSVKRQASTTLNCMQTMARVQHHVLARRIRMSEENQAFQRQLQQKHDLEKSKASMREDWDYRTKSKEQVEEDQQRQQIAAIRRERALAYAYTRQQTWRNSPKQATQTPTDPYNPQWGWNWLEKWMAARPWENMTISEEFNSEPPSAKSVTTLAQKARRDLKLDQLKSSPSPKNRTRTPGRLSVSSPQTMTPRSVSAGRVRAPNFSRRSVHSVDDDDARSTQSTRSELHRRHSLTGPAHRDDESQASLTTPPGSFSPTSSSKAKSRLSMVKSGTPEKDSVGSANKRFTVAGSPSAQRRHSEEPPRTPKVH